MAHYKCPIPTCSLALDGSLSDIYFQASMHSEGSHKIVLTEVDCARIIEKQARGESVEEFLPEEFRQKATPVVVEPNPPSSNTKANIKGLDWWKE